MEYTVLALIYSYTKMHMPSKIFFSINIPPHKKNAKNVDNGQIYFGDELRAILQESEAKLEMKIFNPSSFFVWR